MIKYSWESIPDQTNTPTLTCIQSTSATETEASTNAAASQGTEAADGGWSTWEEAAKALEMDEKSSETKTQFDKCLSIWRAGKDQQVLTLDGEKVPIAGPACIEQKIFVRDIAGVWRAHTIVQYSLKKEEIEKKAGSMMAVAMQQAREHGLKLIKRERAARKGWAFPYSKRPRK